MTTIAPPLRVAATMGIAALVMLSCAAGGPNMARAQDQAAPAYVVTYLEVAPAAHDNAVALLREWVAAVRKNPDNLGIAPLQRREASNHFALIEMWKDQKSFEAQSAAPAGQQFRAALAPLLTAPYDERPHTPLTAEAARSQSAMGMQDPNLVFVLTHVDIVPTKKDEGLAATVALAAPSAKETGNVAYEVLQQNSRPNHMTLFEVWRSEADLMAHASQQFIKSYRNALLPMSGSLYDQRTYAVMR